MNTRISARLDAPLPPPDPNLGHPAGEAAPAPHPRELPELPDTHAQAIANAVQAAKTRVRAEQPARVYVPEIRTAPDSALEKTVKEFKARARPTFHTKDGDVTVSIPFRLPPSTIDPTTDYGKIEQAVQKHQPELVRIASGVGLDAKQVELLQSGRGTPEQVHRLTQALVDAHKLEEEPVALKPEVRVRNMMCKFGIGLDCAGYTQQALLASRDFSRAVAGLKEVMFEDLSGLAYRPAFRRVQDATTARAGDLVVLQPQRPGQYGHTAIVEESRYATGDELQALASRHPKDIPPHLDPSRVKVLVVDSSWGSGGDPEEGGVESRPFFYDEVSKQWLTEYKQKLYVTDKGPYDHKLDGIFRPAGEH